MTMIKPLIFGFFVTVILIFALKKLSYPLNLLDHPGGRKHHHKATPIIGGLAMLGGLFTSLFLLPIALSSYLSLIWGATAYTFLGFIDDRFNLNAKIRLLLQSLIATIIVYFFNFKIIQLGNLLALGSIHLHHLANAFSVFCIVGIINAINMLDGHDGQLASISLIQLIALTLISIWSKNYSTATIIICTLPAITAYLLFNFPWQRSSHSRIFMGDAGSQLLGFCLVWFTINLTQQPHTTIKPVIMLWVMALPLYDFGAVTLRRALQKKSILKAGRDHFHHIMQACGLSKRKTLLASIVATLFFSSIGLINYWVTISDVKEFMGFLGGFGVYIGLGYCLNNNVLSK